MLLEDLIRRIFYGRRKEEKAVANQKLLEDPLLREILPKKLHGNALLLLSLEIFQGISDLEETLQEIETAEKVNDEELSAIDELIEAIDGLRERRHPLAVTLAEVCYRISKRIIKDELRMALCMQALGETQLTLGRTELCMPPLKEAAALFEEDEEWGRAVACYGNLGVAWRRLGDIEAAAEQFMRALELSRLSGDELLVRRTEQWIKDFAGGALPAGDE
jgi:tetratricopeptide (TPR) repeat protein